MDRLHASITPEQMREIMAFELLEPDPLDRIAEILKLGFAALCLSDRVTPDDFEPTRPLDLRKSRAGRELSPNQQVQMLRSIVPEI